ncbi:MAG: TRCF domain-containing protein, partial [Alphaproteobacteria bacterium]
RDLDVRGGGDLLGEDLAGHMALLGVDLYRHVLDRALRRAAGDAVEGDFVPELRLDMADGIPEDYVPDPEMRIALYAAAARLDGVAAVDNFAIELADRFGPPPEAVQNLLLLCRLKVLCRRAGVNRVVAGPKAVVLHLRRDGRADRARPPAGWTREEDRLVRRHPVAPDAEHRGVVAAVRLLQRLAGSDRRRRALPLNSPQSRDGDLPCSAQAQLR